MDNLLAVATDIRQPLQMLATKGREYSEEIELSDGNCVRLYIEQQVPDNLVTIYVVNDDGAIVEKATVCRGGVQIFRSIGLMVCATAL